jgi:hypothetical protein
MTVPRSFPVFAIVFAVAYSVVYVISVWKNYALFTYHPATNEIAWGVEKPKEGVPAMYWYGWLATSGIVASAVAFAACWLPQGLTRRLWSGWSWAAPVAVMVVFCYLLRGYFLR